MANSLRRLAVFGSPRWMCTTTTVSPKPKEDNLFRTLYALRGSESTVTDTLDQWVKDGKPIKRFDIISYVNQLRKFKKYDEAIQLYEWMEKSKNKMNNADRAVRIDLLAKTEGVESAENYFNTLQKSAKTKKTFGSLLSCYCKEKMLDKALGLFEEIKTRNFASTLNYNNMMGLYLIIGQPEKVPLLAQEMEGQNIAADLYTYNHLMNSYASLKDFDALEGVVKKMGTNKVKCNLVTYTNLASIYLNAENLEKTNETLHKMEKLKNLKDREAFHTLINLYARSSNLSGINRVWESFKASSLIPNNTSYLILLLALSKLGDVDTLVKCFREWESECLKYDVRVSNVILESYLKRDMIEEANVIYENMLKKGAEPNLRTFELLANFYIGKRQIDLAMKHLEMGSSKVNPEKDNWFPSDKTVGMFLMYFEEDYDADQAEKFYGIMKMIGRLDSTVNDILLRTSTDN